MSVPTLKAKPAEVAKAVLEDLEQNLFEAIGEIERVALNSKGSAGADSCHGRTNCDGSNALPGHGQCP
jgi:hypothetical protein